MLSGDCTCAIRLKSVQYEVQYGLTHVITSNYYAIMLIVILTYNLIIIIADCLNNKETCDVILLDFTRAFDKVDHNVLRRKLAALGIMGQPLKWLSNFLHERTQFVTFENAISDLVSVTSGVV